MKRKRISFAIAPGFPAAKQCKLAAGSDNKEICETKTRWRGKFWLLTYSRPLLKWTKEYVIDYLKNKKGLQAIEWKVGKENFKDKFIDTLDKHNAENPELPPLQNLHNHSPKDFDLLHHYHVWLHLRSELDVIDSSWGYIDGLSCSYKHAKDFHAAEYTMKDMDYIESGQADFFPISKKYIQLKANHEAWVEDREHRKLKDIDWPIVFPFGYSMGKPDASMKKRHVWLCAPPDWGKTSFINSLGEKKIFDIFGAENPMEHYKDEQLIIIHGVKVDWTLLEFLSDTYIRKMNMPGKQRYNQVRRKGNNPINIIYIGNEMPNYTHMDAFNARFHIFNFYNNNCTAALRLAQASEKVFIYNGP